jgi:hypothetical protein
MFSEHLSMFLKALSGLSDKKKSIIKKMGFGCMLDFTCTSNVNDIFLWLVKQLDPETATVTLENGFSFTLYLALPKRFSGFRLVQNVFIERKPKKLLNSLQKS